MYRFIIFAIIFKKQRFFGFQTFRSLNGILHILNIYICIILHYRVIFHLDHFVKSKRYIIQVLQISHGTWITVSYFSIAYLEIIGTIAIFIRKFVGFTNLCCIIPKYKIRKMVIIKKAGKYSSATLDKRVLGIVKYKIRLGSYFYKWTLNEDITK